MLFVLSRVLSHSNCILILIMSNLATSAPLKSRKSSSSENERGFSASPRILEIQLPLKITSKEDLIAWSKYVMGLMVSKANFTSTNLKDTLSAGKRVSFTDNSASKSKETMKKAPLNEKRLNYPARRLKEPHMRRADDKVVAYPLPIGGMKVASNRQDPFSLSNLNINTATDLGHFTNFDIENPFQQSHTDIFGNSEILAQPPAATYLPIPLRGTNSAVHQNIIDKNISGFEEPAKLQSTKNSFNLRVKAINNEFGQALPIAINNGLTGRYNLSRNAEPLLTFPFQALITITRQLPAATTTSKIQPKDYFAIRTRDPPDEFPPYFEKNYTNESEQINVVLNDFATGTSRKKIEESVQEEEKEEEEEEEKEEENTREKKKKSEKKSKTKKQKLSRKRQFSVLGDLLRMLGILRKLPKNTTEVNVATPVLSILKGTNPTKVQVAFEEQVPETNRGRRNETFQAQEELNDDSDEEEEEEEGGSIQGLIDLLPLAAPILEDLSDPNSDIDIGEVLQSAIPLLEGLSDPNEEGGVDIPAILVPLSQRLSEGPEGEGSDSGAILGPLIQLIAPLIGPLSGPLIGPLSRTSSGPRGKEGSGSIITQLVGPLSKPQGPYGQSILSGLVASITAKLSKELAASAGDSDVKSLVSSIVSGVLAGTSAGSSGPNKGHRDTYYAPTTYGSYNSYKPQMPNIGDMISASIKEILGAFLKLSATSSSSSAGLSGASSSSSATLSTSSSDGSLEPPKNPAYGAPTDPPYAPPPSMRPAYAPAPTSSPYTTFKRRQIRQ